MSPPKRELEFLLREYLDYSKKEEEARDFGLLLEYLSHLYEDSEEPILLEDFSAYEADDFLQFFLEDKFPEDKKLKISCKHSIKNFFQYLLKKNMIHKEEISEWKEVLK